MRHPLLRTLLWAGPAAFSFLVVLLLAARFIDHRLNLAWPLPAACSLPALLLIPAGAALGLWCIWLFAAVGRGTPNPLAPPLRLVVQGPYRCSRNPMMLGGWLVGFGLALALRSPSLLAACLVVVLAGALYVPLLEEPRLLRRFGSAYRDYMGAVPRWLCAQQLPGSHCRR